jgi:dienelactone hydrolase
LLYKISAGAGHGYYTDTRPASYTPGAAPDAWQRTLDFFRDRLGS